MFLFLFTCIHTFSTTCLVRGRGGLSAQAEVKCARDLLEYTHRFGLLHLRQELPCGWIIHENLSSAAGFMPLAIDKQLQQQMGKEYHTQNDSRLLMNFFPCQVASTRSEVCCYEWHLHVAQPEL